MAQGPYQAGAGYIQSEPPDGVTSQEAPTPLGAGAFSNTDSIEPPFRTHTWLSNWFWANGSPSSAPQDDQYYVNWNGTAWSTQQRFSQGPIYGYPMMWRYSNVADTTPGLLLSTPDLSLQPGGPVQGATSDAPDLMSLTSSGIGHLQIFPGNPGGGPPTPAYLPVAMQLDQLGDWHGRFRGADPADAGTWFEVTVAQGSPFTWVADVGSAWHTFWSLSQLGPAIFWELLDDSDSGTGVANVQALVAGVYIDNAGGLNQVSSMHLFAVFYDPAAVSQVYPQGLAANQPSLGGSAVGGLVFSATGTAASPNRYAVAALPFVEVPNPPASFSLSASALDAIRQMAPRALNVLTGTEVGYEVSAGTVTTTYTATVDTSVNPAVPPSDGTVLCLMPHHYAAYDDGRGAPVLVPETLQPLDADGSQLQYQSIRGPLRAYLGGGFQTRYVFNNFLPHMPAPASLWPSGLDPAVAGNLWNLECFSWSGAVPPPDTPTQPFGVPLLQSPMDSYAVGKVTAARAKEIAFAEVLLESGYQGATGSCAGFSPSAMATSLLGGVQQVIESYFQQNPVTPANPPFTGSPPGPPPFVMPYFTRYDSGLHTLLMYPASATSNPSFPLPGSMDGNTDVDNAPFDGYGTVTLLNDHFFHYGYFIYAAAQAALRDPEWAKAWAPAIDQLAMDIAYDPKADSAPGKDDGWHRVDGMTFPKLRYFDAWSCHGWASGLLAGQVYANNIESISEEINAWAALVLWGEATNRPKIRDLGIYLYTSAVYASDTYWFDKLGIYRGAFNGMAVPSVAQTQPGYPAGATYQSSSVHAATTSTAAQVWGGQATSSTFFGTFPVQSTAIVCVPVNPGAGLYLGRDADYVRRWFDAIAGFSAQVGCPPPYAPLEDGVPGPAQVNSYASFMNRVQALGAGGGPAALNWVQDNILGAPTLNAASAYMDNGDTIAEPYMFDLSIWAYGEPDWSLYADAALAAAFKDSSTGTVTYAAYNPGPAPLTVNFYTFGLIPPAPVHTMTVQPRQMKVD